MLKKKKKKSVAGRDNANQTQAWFTLRLNTLQTEMCEQRKVPVSSLVNYGFISLLNILSQYKQMSITASHSVLLPQLFNF